MSDAQHSTVLLVDDAPLNIDFLTVLLNRAGFRVWFVQDGETALRKAKQMQPDIILLDVMMPGLDGFETCRRLKADKTTQEIPVIFMTAVTDIQSKVKGFEIGGVDYITKPIDHPELVARVTTHLTIRNLQRDLQQEINERRKTEETLRQYTAVLQTQNEELDAFAHTVAHNLKNPLAALTGLASLLKLDHGRMTPEEIREIAVLIEDAGRKSIKITEALLLLASVRKSEAEVAPLDMAAIVAHSQNRLANMIEQHQAELIGPEEWPTALGYAPWIEEVWVNYISNAIKYGGKPPLIELGATTRMNGKVHFWVKDNGPGLTPEEQAQLFTPFTRLSKVDIEGHGLGLSIVRRIVEKLDGEVQVKSDGIPNQGSVFSFTLPAAG